MKVSRKKVTLWHYTFLSVRTGINVINGIIIVPLYINYINLSLYGAWLATGNILAWITIIDPGVSDVLLQRVANALGKNNHKEVGNAIGAGIIISVIIFFAVVIGGISLSNFITDIIKFNNSNTDILINSFRLAVLGSAFNLLANTPNNIIYAFQKTKEAGVINTSISILSIILNILLLLNNYGLYALAYTILFNGTVKLLITSLYSVKILINNNIRTEFNLKYCKDFSKVFIYTFTSRTIEVIANNIDLIIVSRFIGPQYVVILELSRRPIKIALGFVNNITASMYPALSHLVGSGNFVKVQETAQKSINIIIWFAGYTVGGFILFNRSLIQIWTGNEMYFGTLNNNLMCLALLGISISYMCSCIIYTMGDIKGNSLITFSRNILYISFLYIIAKYFHLNLNYIVTTYFLSVVLIDLVVYPLRLIKTIDLKKEQLSLILHETLILIVVQGLLCFFSFKISLLNIYEIIGASLIYTILYTLVLTITSSSFKENLSKILILAQSKLITEE